MVEEELETIISDIDIKEINSVGGESNTLKLRQVFPSLSSLFLKRWIKEVTLD